MTGMKSVRLAYEMFKQYRAFKYLLLAQLVWMGLLMLGFAAWEFLFVGNLAHFSYKGQALECAPIIGFTTMIGEGLGSFVVSSQAAIWLFVLFLTWVTGRLVLDMVTACLTKQAICGEQLIIKGNYWYGRSALIAIMIDLFFAILLLTLALFARVAPLLILGLFIPLLVGIWWAFAQIFIYQAIGSGEQLFSAALSSSFKCLKFGVLFGQSVGMFLLCLWLLVPVVIIAGLAFFVSKVAVAAVAILFGIFLELVRTIAKSLLYLDSVGKIEPCVTEQVEATANLDSMN